MRRTSPVLSALLLLLVGVLVASPTATAARGSQQPPTAVKHVDPRISHQDCTLLGRQWATHVVTAKGKPASNACSRVACLDSADYAKQDPNAETCVVGGRKGRAYGLPISEYRCHALNRRWIDLLNYCVSEPHRTAVRIPDAAQCRAPASTYVELKARAETEGFYDECLTPGRVDKLKATARKTDQSFVHVATVSSRVECGYRPRRVFKNGSCRHTDTIPASEVGGVLEVGDSVSWRGSNELQKLHPTWDIDAIPGRPVDYLLDRIKRFEFAHGRPTGLIIALGTNPSPHWQQKDYLKAAEQVATGKPVMFVTPYRFNGSSGQAKNKAATRYTRMMFSIAKHHSAQVCVANWRHLASSRPNILVDGIHETSKGEPVWAHFIDKNWTKCVAHVKKAMKAHGTGSGSGSGSGSGGSGGGTGGGGTGGGGGGGGGPLPLPPITIPGLPPIQL